MRARTARGCSASGLFLEGSRLAPGELQQRGRVTLFGDLSPSMKLLLVSVWQTEEPRAGRRWQVPGSRGVVTHRHPSLTPCLPLPRLSQLRAGALPSGLAQGQAEDEHCLTAQAQTPRLKPRLCLMPAV